MSVFEAIYVDIKKTGSKAANFVVSAVVIALLIFLLLNIFVISTCPWPFMLLFVVLEGWAVGALFAGRFRVAGVVGFMVLVMLFIAVAKTDSPWSFERQPLERAVIKLGNQPIVELLKPRILAEKIRHWNQVFELGMKKPDPKRNIIVLGGFEIESSVGFLGFKTKSTNINLLDVKRIEHETGIAVRKIILRNGSVITGQGLRFTNFMALNPGRVWIEGKTRHGKKLKIDFDKLNQRGDYIEFHWQ